MPSQKVAEQENPLKKGWQPPSRFEFVDSGANMEVLFFTSLAVLTFGESVKVSQRQTCPPFLTL